MERRLQHEILRRFLGGTCLQGNEGFGFFFEVFPAGRPAGVAKSRHCFLAMRAGSEAFPWQPLGGQDVAAFGPGSDAPAHGLRPTCDRKLAPQAMLAVYF